MKLTKDFLIAQNACAEGIKFHDDQNFEGKEYSEVIRSCIELGESDFAGWLLEQKKKEHYVRLNGNIITMKAYQVFNPITGTHEKYETEELATQALVEVIKQIINHHNPTVCQEIANENGDTAWTAVDLMPKIQITTVGI
jgi:hypothetical protein